MDALENGIQVPYDHYYGWPGFSQDDSEKFDQFFSIDGGPSQDMPDEILQTLECHYAPYHQVNDTSAYTGHTTAAMESLSCAEESEENNSGDNSNTRENSREEIARTSEPLDHTIETAFLLDDIHLEIEGDATEAGNSFTRSTFISSEDQEFRPSLPDKYDIPFRKIGPRLKVFPSLIGKSTVEIKLMGCKGGTPSVPLIEYAEGPYAGLPSVQGVQIPDERRVVNQWTEPISIDPVLLVHDTPSSSAHTPQDSGTVDTLISREFMENSGEFQGYENLEESRPDSHVNNAHDVYPVLYECHYVPCPFKSKRESSCRLHMQKYHGWTDIGGKDNSDNGFLQQAEISDQQISGTDNPSKPNPTFEPSPSFWEYPLEGIINNTNNSIVYTNVTQSAPYFPTTSHRPLVNGPKSSVSNIRRPKKRRKKLSKSAVAVLEEWVHSHLENPYPSAHDKGHLANSSGLTKIQVSNWFANFRKRQLSSIPHGGKGLSDPLSVEDSNAASRTSRQMTPMESWLSSSEDEAVSEKSILRALQSDLYSELNLSTPPIESPSPLSSPGMIDDKQESPKMVPSPTLFCRDYTPSEPSSYAESSQESSTGSAFSQCSDATLSGPPRRGRRVLSQRDYSPYLFRRPNKRQCLGNAEAIRVDGDNEVTGMSSVIASKSEPKFQCTFCHITLSRKSWKRHEETQHLPVRRWTCMPNGFYEKYLFSYKICVFCPVLDPDLAHIESCHRIADCLQRDIEERTFERKDHLVQHLKKFHDTVLDESQIKRWSSLSKRPEQTWSCGFCGKELQTWAARATHIARHFLDGKDMSSWSSLRVPLPHR